MTVTIKRLNPSPVTLNPSPRALVRGPQGAPGGSDQSFAEWVADDNSLTHDAIRGLLDPAATSTARLMSKLRADQDDAAMVFVGDSSLAIYGTPLPDRLAARLAAEFPSYTVKIARWNTTNIPTPNPGDYGSWVTVQTGTGAHTLWVYNGSAGTTNTRYPLTQLVKMVVAPSPDLVIISHGANELVTSATHTAGVIRAAYLCLTETIRDSVPTASILCISQHPVGAAGAADSSMVAGLVRQVCEARGYGYVNMTQVFADLGGSIGSYLQDGTHCNDLGQALWFDTIWKRAFSQVVPVPGSLPPSSFIQPTGRDLLTNGQFASFSAPSDPTGWLSSNVTLAKDVTNYDGSGGNAYCLKMTSLGTGLALLLQAVNAKTLARLKGKYVTLTARVRADTPAASGSSQRGTVWLYDGTTFVQGIPDVWSDSQFVYHAVTMKVDAAASQLTAYLVCDSSTTNVGTVNQWEWATLVKGILPTIPTLSDAAAVAVAAHIVNPTGAHAASAIANTPAGNIAATTVQAALNELDTEKQPVDSDLTSIAALSTTSYGRALLELANQAALVALLPSYQPLDSDLTAIAALASAADKLAYATGSGAWALTDLSSFIRTLLDDANAAAAQATLGVPPNARAIGTGTASATGLSGGGDLSADRALVIEDTGWTTLTLQNSWVAYGAPYATPQYRRLGRRVEVKGIIKNGTATAATLLFTLPAGYRPAASRVFPGFDGALATRWLDLTTGGAVTLGSAVTNTLLTLDGISFIAEA